MGGRPFVACSNPGVSHPRVHVTRLELKNFRGLVQAAIDFSTPVTVLGDVRDSELHHAKD